MKFRKKPVVIEAAEVKSLLHAAKNDWDALPLWLRNAYEKGHILFLPDSVEVNTLEGTMTASKGDWLICGVKGEIYPCKDDIFRATYDVVEEERQAGRHEGIAARLGGFPPVASAIKDSDKP